MENIDRDNRLIAEFMGAYAQSDRIEGNALEYEMYGIIECIEDGENKQHFFRPEEMKFHTSWAWLMPVVEEIESLALHELIYKTSSERFPTVYMYKQRCIIKDTGDFTNTNVFDGRGRLHATYGAVVEFIKWYNETN